MSTKQNSSSVDLHELIITENNTCFGIAICRATSDVSIMGTQRNTCKFVKFYKLVIPTMFLHFLFNALTEMLVIARIHLLLGTLKVFQFNIDKYIIYLYYLHSKELRKQVNYSDT